MPVYEDGLKVADARVRYFRDNAFGDDGGYAKKWVRIALGPLAIFVPNTAARVRAVRLHDLHHVATAYDTDLVGEAEIAAWEIASGCGGYVAAWVLNLYAMGIGLFVGREAIWRAFLRGRRSGSLYHAAWDEQLLDASVGELRAGLRLAAAEAPRPTAADRVAFGFWIAAALALALATVALLLAPVVLLIRALV